MEEGSHLNNLVSDHVVQFFKDKVKVFHTAYLKDIKIDPIIK